MRGAESSLRLAERRGPLVGLANMVDKELGTWWRTRRALIHLGIWFLAVNGFILLDGGADNPFTGLDELVELFFRIGLGFFAGIGAVLTTQSAIVGEKQLGTAEWVLSKPVTRHAFLLSKLFVDAGSFLVLAVLVPTVVLFVQLPLMVYLQPDLTPFLAGLAILIEHTLFYIALTLALGTLFDSRGPVSGLAIGVLVAGLVLINIWPSTQIWSPWGLPAIAYGTAMGHELPEFVAVPILATAGWTLLLIGTAHWRFARTEL